jgi:hypothetical protein
VNTYSVLTMADAEPVLVREGFAWPALILGPLWMAAQRAWIPAAITLAADIIILILAPDPTRYVLLGGLAVILGLVWHDLQVWSLEQQGWLLQHVVAARSKDAAWMRLIDQRPELGRLVWANLP